MKSVENAYSQAFFKMFNTYDKHIIEQCQFYMGCLPVHLLIDLRKLTFLDSLHVSVGNNMSLLHHLAKWTDLDFDRLKLKYGISGNASSFNYKRNIFEYFHSSICLNETDFA